MILRLYPKILLEKVPSKQLSSKIPPQRAFSIKNLKVGHDHPNFCHIHTTKTNHMALEQNSCQKNIYYSKNQRPFFISSHFPTLNPMILQEVILWSESISNQTTSHNRYTFIIFFKKIAYFFIFWDRKKSEPLPHYLKTTLNDWRAKSKFTQSDMNSLTKRMWSSFARCSMLFGSSLLWCAKSWKPRRNYYKGNK